LQAGREPYGNLVGGLSSMESMEGVADWAKPYIQATLSYYNKTVEDLFKDIKKNDDDFVEYMRFHHSSGT